jgi:hypothetical protein
MKLNTSLQYPNVSRRYTEVSIGKSIFKNDPAKLLKSTLETAMKKNDIVFIHIYMPLLPDNQQLSRHNLLIDNQRMQTAIKKIKKSIIKQLR